MQSYILYEKNPSIKVIETVVSAIRDGAIVIYPTDSVYAIGCDALNSRAIERIYKYRGDDEQKSPLSIVCKDISQANEYTRISNDQFKVLRKNLPGPFTFILEAGLKRVLKTALASLNLRLESATSMPRSLRMRSSFASYLAHAVALFKRASIWSICLFQARIARFWSPTSVRIPFFYMARTVVPS